MNCHNHRKELQQRMSKVVRNIPTKDEMSLEHIISYKPRQAEEITTYHQHRAKDLNNQSHLLLKLATWNMANH